MEPKIVTMVGFCKKKNEMLIILAKMFEMKNTLTCET